MFDLHRLGDQTRSQSLTDPRQQYQMRGFPDEWLLERMRHLLSQTGKGQLTTTFNVEWFKDYYTE